MLVLCSFFLVRKPKTLQSRTRGEICLHRLPSESCSFSNQASKLLPPEPIRTSLLSQRGPPASCPYFLIRLSNSSLQTSSWTVLFMLLLLCCHPLPCFSSQASFSFVFLKSGYPLGYMRWGAGVLIYRCLGVTPNQLNQNFEEQNLGRSIMEKFRSPTGDSNVWHS